MADDNSDKIWDEYDWERFLQRQEERTMRYMELLDKYIDHPQRDEIIAREMGWDHLLDDDWEDEVDAAFEREMEDEDEEDEEFAEEDDEEAMLSCERNPLYRQAIAFASELDEAFESLPGKVQEHPAAVSLSSQTTLATAKLAAALCDDDDELGMSIAYLKRALHAINGGLTSAKQLADSEIIPRQLAEKIFRRLFSLREGIVDKMGAYRTEFRRRHG